MTLKLPANGFGLLSCVVPVNCRIIAFHDIVNQALWPSCYRSVVWHKLGVDGRESLCPVDGGCSGKRKRSQVYCRFSFPGSLE